MRLAVFAAAAAAATGSFVLLSPAGEQRKPASELRDDNQASFQTLSRSQEELRPASGASIGNPAAVPAKPTLPPGVVAGGPGRFDAHRDSWSDPAANAGPDGLPVKLSAPPAQREGAMEARARQRAAERVEMLKAEEERMRVQLEFGRARYAAAVAVGVEEQLASAAYFRHEQRAQEVAVLLRRQGADGSAYYKDALAARLPPSMLWDVAPFLRASADRERRIRGGAVELWPENEYASYCVTAPVGKREGECDPLGTFIFGLFPSNGPCPVRDRVGNIHDGGKWTCAPQLVRRAGRCTIYSFGVADDTSFETAMLRGSRNCAVHAFDIAFDVLALQPEDADVASRISYKAIGLAPDSYTHVGHTFASLGQIMQELGHDYVDILKLDIEGAELNVGIQAFWDWAQAGRTPIGQLLVELHMADQPPWKLTAFFRAAEAAGLVPFHSELNPVPCLELSNLPRRPDFHEFSFVHVGNMRSRYNWSEPAAAPALYLRL